MKDEHTLTATDWDRTRWIAQHGTLAAGYLTGRFDAVSVSAAASTGILDLRTNTWRKEMLGALADEANRERAWNCLPPVVPGDVPLGPLSDEFGVGVRPLVFPTLDDQAAGLVGGGATDPGHVALILGNSAVVNSSATSDPVSGTLDVMKLNWGPYLWMRCYSNGAQFLDRVVGTNPDWAALEAAAQRVPDGCGGITVSPFVLSEPSIGVHSPDFGWTPSEPAEPGVRFRAALEALAKLIARAVREHEAAGQHVTRVTASGGIARSTLMIQILANEIGKPVETLASNEGSALGAAVVALAGLETTLRKQSGDLPPYTVTDAVAQLVKVRSVTRPGS